MHPSGLVITVNEMRRIPFTGGLGGHGKQDEIRINLTIVNTGLRTFRLEPNKDFAIELGKMYFPQEDPEGRAQKQPFNVFPSTQSRIDLYFKVPSDDTYDPILIFNLEDSEARVLCSPDLEALVEKSNKNLLNTQEAVRLAQFYIDSSRYSEAQKLVERALAADPNNNQLLMQMASIYEGNYDKGAAAEYLERVNPASITSYDEACTLARQAVNLGHYRLAIAVLEPYELINKLDEKSRVVLARAYYYEDDFASSEKILNQLVRDGTKDRLVFFTLGNIKDKLNNTEDAIKFWEKAIELDPDYCEAYFNLGVGYFKQQNIEKAREYWKKVLLLQPDSSILEATEDALKATEY
ncbi:MAG: hypothetical protein Kow0029_05570 [Candidatus Rifleibacteriota bacterium]